MIPITGETDNEFSILIFDMYCDMLWLQKHTKCDGNGIKNRYFAAKSQKLPRGPGGFAPQAPSVMRLSCIGLFSTGPNTD